MFDRKKGRTSRKIRKRTNFITVEHIYGRTLVRPNIFTKTVKRLCVLSSGCEPPGTYHPRSTLCMSTTGCVFVSILFFYIMYTTYNIHFLFFLFALSTPLFFFSRSDNLTGASPCLATHRDEVCHLYSFPLIGGVHRTILFLSSGR